MPAIFQKEPATPLKIPLLPKAFPKNPTIIPTPAPIAPIAPPLAIAPDKGIILVPTPFMVSFRPPIPSLPNKALLRTAPVPPPLDKAPASACSPLDVVTNPCLTPPKNSPSFSKPVNFISVVLSVTTINSL